MASYGLDADINMVTDILTPQAFQCRHAMEHDPEDAANGRRRRRLVLPEGVVENMLMLVEWFLGATPSWAMDMFNDFNDFNVPIL